MRAEKNEMELKFDALSENEAFARISVAAFVTHLNPTMEELADIKTAVSEAVTNSIIHGYENWQEAVQQACDICKDNIQTPLITIKCRLEHSILHIVVEDKGRGIADIPKAMEPLYTTKPEMGRSGMGFSFMEAFMDDVEVESTLGVGTTVRMTKKIGLGSWSADGE